jgi:hypothetical protein
VNDVDPKAWVDAAHTYQRLRRHTLLLPLGYVGSFVGFAICFFCASAKTWDAFAGTLFLLYIPVSIVLGLGMFIVSLDLRGFRCPRCGKRFTVSWRNSWPTNRCKHCRLDLIAAVKDAGKSSALEEFWEQSGESPSARAVGT